MQMIVPPEGLAFVRYRGEHDVQNTNVNAANLLGVEKGNIAWYPDNEGTPAIDFLMMGVNKGKGSRIQWLIPKHGLSKGERCYGSFHQASLLRDHLLQQILDGVTRPQLPTPEQADVIYEQAKVLERAADEARMLERHRNNRW